MFKSLLSKRNFARVSDFYWRESKAFFCMGCLHGTFYSNPKFEHEFGFSELWGLTGDNFFQNDTFIKIKDDFYGALKEPDLNDYNARAVLVFVSMHRGFDLGERKEIEVLRFLEDWDRAKEKCGRFFEAQYSSAIRDEYLALAADKGIFIFLRQSEYERYERAMKEVKARISRRVSYLEAADVLIIKESFSQANAIIDFLRSDLELQTEEAELLRLRLLGLCSSYIRAWVRLEYHMLHFSIIFDFARTTSLNREKYNKESIEKVFFEGCFAASQLFEIFDRKKLRQIDLFDSEPNNMREDILKIFSVVMSDGEQKPKISKQLISSVLDLVHCRTREFGEYQRFSLEMDRGAGII